MWELFERLSGTPSEDASSFHETFQAINTCLNDRYTFQPKIEQLLDYYKPKDDGSRAQFLKQSTFSLFLGAPAKDLPGGEVEKKFVAAVSDFLNLEETLTVQLLTSFYTKRLLKDGVKTVNFETLDVIKSVADYLTEEKKALLYVLRELLEVDQVSDGYHLPSYRVCSRIFL